MKKIFQKTFYAALCLTLGLCLMTACGKDTDSKDTPDSDLQSPVVSFRPVDNPDENNSDGDDNTDDALTDNEEQTDEEENGDGSKKDKDGNDDASSTDSPNVQVQTASGYMNGFGDSHTVEITLDNGEIVSYQVHDEDALSKLEGYDTGSSEDTFSFTYTEENGYLTIISVD